MKMRIISAIIALAILIPIIVLGGYPFILGASIIAILAYKEIIDLKKSHKKIPELMVAAGLFSMLLLTLTNFRGSSLTIGFSYQRLILCILLLLTPTVFYKNDKYTTKDAFYLIGNILFLSLIFNLIIIIRNRSIYLLIYLLAIPMITDTFALVFGKMFGKNKLCPEVSPKKTWEGFFGGLACGAIIGTIIYWLLLKEFSFEIILVTAVLSIMGQIGDLLMSKVKRENDIKDFSNIMPGHGGILDRIDSIIFVVLTYLLLVLF